MQKTNRILNLVYYLMYTLAVIVAVVMWQFVTKGIISAIDPFSTAAKVMQNIAIFYTIISVAGGLYLFKRQLPKIQRMEDQQEQLSVYGRWAIVRLIVIGIGVSFDIFVFYLLGGHRPMIWCAAISAIGLYFCKPTIRRIELELNQSDPL